MYEGDFKEGIKDGKGRHFLPNGILHYEGDYVAENYEGQGTIYYTDGGKYEGAVHNDKVNGIGVWTLPDGTIHCGLFEDEYLIHVGID